MQSWEDIVTDRSLHLQDIQRFLERVQGLEPYRNTHYAFATGGTTGVKGVTVFSKREFLLFFAQTSRTTRWMGMCFPLGGSGRECRRCNRSSRGMRLEARHSSGFPW